VAAAGDVCRGAGGELRFAGCLGGGMTVGGVSVQQGPSSWCSCDHHHQRQWSSGALRLPECALPPARPDVSASATATSIHPNSIRRIDALASIINNARLIGKSPPGRSYGQVRWDL